jgi:superfamily I DNA/RNA helicase
VKGLTFDCVLMPKLVEKNFKRVPAEIRKRLLLVGITRATKWVYFSSVAEYELNELDTIRLAAANGDVFIKDTSVATTAPTASQADDEDEDLFL